jgi:hypothetical protein
MVASKRAEKAAHTLRRSKKIEEGAGRRVCNEERHLNGRGSIFERVLFFENSQSITKTSASVHREQLDIALR